jgi:multiple sugar transport system permease protein
MNPASRRNRGPRSKTRRAQLAGLAFASPWLIGLVVLGLYPIAASLYYSFCRYNILRPPRFTGLENYRLLFTEDPLFWKSLWNTAWLTVIGLPLQLASALGAAMLLNARVRGVSLFRTVFYLPTLVPAVATGIVWLWILNPDYGLLNSWLQTLHLPAPGWMSDPRWSKPALVLVTIWGMGGTMVIFLAGLQQVPSALYEAAVVDGASAWQRFRNVTIPLLSPVILFNLIMGIIGSFQYFTTVYVMTSGVGASGTSGTGAQGVGGPENSTMVYPLYLYQNAFLYFRMGYASAMAWVLFLIVAVLVVLVFRTSGWVHYESSEERP